jgi:hypothetical protein
VSAQLDHLIVAAATLADGVAWCEATLGVAPGPGGEHVLFGTHNRLLKLACADAPNVYLEIIAINPAAEPTRAPPLQRWFDLDQPALRASLAQNGPQLIHWVASVPQLGTALPTWRQLGIDRGPALTASRPTPAGLLQWQIAVRDDGQRLLNGCLPTLIEWGGVHPAQSMPDSGLTLNRLTLRHPDAHRLTAALTAIGLTSATVTAGPPALWVELQTPRGPVTVRSLA